MSLHCNLPVLASVLLHLKIYVSHVREKMKKNKGAKLMKIGSTNLILEVESVRFGEVNPHSDLLALHLRAIEYVLDVCICILKGKIGNLRV